MVVIVLFCIVQYTIAIGFVVLFHVRFRAFLVLLIVKFCIHILTHPAPGNATVVGFCKHVTFFDFVALGTLFCFHVCSLFLRIDLYKNNRKFPTQRMGKRRKSHPENIPSRKYRWQPLILQGLKIPKREIDAEGNTWSASGAREVSRKHLGDTLYAVCSRNVSRICTWDTGPKRNFAQTLHCRFFVCSEQENGIHSCVRAFTGNGTKGKHVDEHLVHVRFQEMVQEDSRVEVCVFTSR